MVLDRAAGGEKGAARPDRLLTQGPAVICSGYNGRFPPGQCVSKADTALGATPG